MDPDLGCNHGSRHEVLDVMFLFIVDLANNFDAFLISNINLNFSKSSCPGTCEVVVSIPRFIAGAHYITSLRKC